MESTRRFQSLVESKGLAMNQAQFRKETSSSGEFRRQVSHFRNWVTADGSSPHPAEAGRYHLYVSSACPWAHRTIIARKLKKLESVIGITIVDPLRDENGWAFIGESDPINGFRFLSEAYEVSDSNFDGRVTVPVLWDMELKVIVNNESQDILRMLNSEFGAFSDNSTDLFPAPLREEIETLNARIYETVNNGVYRAGFATSQEAYEAAVVPLFETLTWLDQRLSSQRYLLGDQHTETDWRLFTTLVRFDAVYHGHFKCNLRMLADFPNLWGYTRDLYQVPGVAETVNFDHIKRHYYITHRAINPTGVVPLGPELDFAASHDRAGILK